MIRVAIVDDDKEILKQLSSYVMNYQEEINEKFHITTFIDAEQIVKDYRSVYDIIFMDIQMPSMDGLTAAKKIRQLDQEVMIIFVTNMAEFAIKGYTVDALSYVVKPIRYVDFSQQLSKAVKKMLLKKNTFILVTINNEIMRLDVSKITYLESVDHKVVIHMEDEDISINSSLKKMEEQLKGYYFMRCNSGYLVNLSHVEEVTKDEVTVGGISLLISRSRKKKFMSALTEYLGGDYR